VQVAGKGLLGDAAMLGDARSGEAGDLADFTQAFDKGVWRKTVFMRIQAL